MAKIDFLIKYLDSLLPWGIPKTPIYIAVTDAKEREGFQERLAEHSMFGALTFFNTEAYLAPMPEVLPHLSHGASGIVILKKFAVLHYCATVYDFIVCIDCDSIAVQSIDDMMVVAKVNYDKKQYFGASDTEIFCERFASDCRRFFPMDQLKLIDATDNGRHYTWFFDIPSYAKSDLEGFFSTMAFNCGSLSNFFRALTHDSFEYILFQYYMFLNNNAEYINYTKTMNITTPSEHLNKDELDQINEKYSYHPVWMSQRAYVDSQSDKIFMLFHTDR